MAEADLDDFSEFLTSLSFPKLVTFMLEQFAKDEVDDDILDETFDYFLFFGAGGSVPFLLSCSHYRTYTRRPLLCCPEVQRNIEDSGFVGSCCLNSVQELHS